MHLIDQFLYYKIYFCLDQGIIHFHKACTATRVTGHPTQTVRAFYKKDLEIRLLAYNFIIYCY